MFGRLKGMLGYSDRVFPELCLASYALATFIIMHSSVAVAQASTQPLAFGDFPFSSTAPPSGALSQQALADFVAFTKSKLFANSSDDFGAQITAVSFQLQEISSHSLTHSLLLGPQFLDTVVRTCFHTPLP